MKPSPPSAARVPLALSFALSLAACGGSHAGGGGDAGPRGDGSTPPPVPGHGTIFEQGAFFYDDVSAANARSDTAAITALMRNYTTNVAHTGPHGFGTGTSELRIDFSIVVNVATATTTKQTFTTDPDYYYAPDCDHAPMPLPAGGAVEQTDGVTPDFSTALSAYECAGFDDGDDCHLLVVAPLEHRLYEIYHATRRANGTFIGGCQAIFATDQALGAGGRGLHCSSADAGGFPIAPMLFSADDVAAGEIAHAIRLVLPNDLIVDRRFVAPATHATNSGGPAGSVPYGARFRLRADFPLATLSAGAQVIARALQRYGMILADGGQVALTAESDLLTEHTWAEVGVDAYSLATIDADDFEILDAGASTYDDWDCQRTPLSQ